jgi:CRP-like cAMP-binding protein
VAADFLDEKRREMTSRMTELAPLVAEYRRLEEAVAALDAIGAPAKRTAPRKGKGKGTSRAAAAGGAARKRGRPKGSGTRRAEALAIVTANPGITVAEVAEKLGINQNYLYRVMPALAQEGLIVRSGRGWVASGS